MDMIVSIIGLILGILLLIMSIAVLICIIYSGGTGENNWWISIPLCFGVILIVISGSKIHKFNTQSFREVELQAVIDNYYLVQFNEKEKTYLSYREKDNYQQSKVEVKGNCYIIQVEENYHLEQVKSKGKDYVEYYFYIPIDSFKF